MTATPGSTHNAGNEAVIGATQTPHIPKATSTRARGRTRRKSPLDTTWIVRRTSFGSAIRTTLTVCQAPPLSCATWESRAHFYHAGPRTVSGRRSGPCTAGPTNATQTGEYCQITNEEPRTLRREVLDRLQSVVGCGHHVLRILPRDDGPTKDRLGRNAFDGHHLGLAPASVT